MGLAGELVEVRLLWLDVEWSEGGGRVEGEEEEGDEEEGGGEEEDDDGVEDVVVPVSGCCENERKRGNVR